MSSLIHKNGQMLYHHTNPKKSISNEVIIGSIIKVFVMFMKEFAKTETLI